MQDGFQQGSHQERADGLQAHLDYIVKTLLDRAVVTEGKTRAAYTDAYAIAAEMTYSEASAKVGREVESRVVKEAEGDFIDLLRGVVDLLRRP